MESETGRERPPAIHTNTDRQRQSETERDTASERAWRRQRKKETRKGNDRGERSHGGWRVRQAGTDRLRFALTQTDRKTDRDSETEKQHQRESTKEREKDADKERE